MDKVAIRSAIHRALSARAAVAAAGKLVEESRQVQVQAEQEYKAAVGNLGTALGPSLASGVLCDGMLVRVDLLGAFGGQLLVSPVVDTLDVSAVEPPAEPKPAAAVTVTGEHSKAEKNRAQRRGS